jgi:hypothetical protein
MHRLLLLVAALLASGCADSAPAAPTKVYAAALSVSQPQLGPCSDGQCAYSAVVTNAGPDCATRVSVAVTMLSSGYVMAVGQTAGTMRPGQVVTVSGRDWPSNGVSPQVSVKGDPIACP